MKKFATLLLASVFVLLGTQVVMNLNLAPTAMIKVEGISPLEAEVEGRDFQSTGLSVVGVGERVYVIGSDADGEDVLSYTWMLTGPTGSTAALDSTGTAGNTFRPDMTGTFEVALDITTASGTAATSLTITAAEYVGVGSLGGATPNTAAGQCGTCHSGITAGWAMTEHSTFFSNSIDGLGGFRNEGCIGCHTAGYNTDAEAVNGGFDDVQADLGWVFPDTLQDGNWQDMLDNYPQLAQLANIQCENCHGPGDQHLGNAEKIAVSLDESVCGTCHEDGHYHLKNSQWKLSGHSVGVASAANRAGSVCVDCHSGWGFIAKVDPASNHDQASGSPQISCAVCHDPHDTTYPDQLRKVDNVTLNNGTVVNWGGNGKLCMNCHMGRRDAESYAAEYHGHFGPHYSNQADMLAGENAITFGRYIAGSTHWDALDDACVDCHMYSPKEGEPGFGAIETGHAEDLMSPLGEHSWRMDWENEETGEVIENVGACRTCHGEGLQTFADVIPRGDADGDGNADESAQEEVDGLMEQVAMMLPPLGEPEVEVAPEYSPLQLRAAFNYEYVYSDGSHGLHNFRYAVNLLTLTKQVLEFGVLTPGAITGIADVPNDQGRQVTVAWSRFGGDGPSDIPLQTYYVWTKVDAPGKFEGRVFDSFADVPADPEELGNARVQSGHEVWTSVGSQPAAQMDAYAAVVPTLADSTADDGAVWSHFMVSGHAADSQIYVVSAVDSAYSIDNLAPAAPGNVMAADTDSEVKLTWDDVADADFAYYTIVRSDLKDFDPTLVDPLGTTTSPEFVDTGVALGATYYYQVAAYDFSGNRGAFSKVKTVLVNIETDGIPTEFALRPNYPNPFNPATRITFAVPEVSNVKITVVDVSGKQVAVLYDGLRQPGTYNLTWNAGTLASGVYITRMEAGSFVDARAMTLLR